MLSSVVRIVLYVKKNLLQRCSRLITSVECFLKESLGSSVASDFVAGLSCKVRVSWRKWSKVI